MLAVNNSKNPAHDAKSSAKYSRVGEDAGSCCNHGKNPRGGVGGYGLLMRVVSSCNVAPKNHTDVLRHEEQTKCNSSLHLGRGTWSYWSTLRHCGRSWIQHGTNRFGTAPSNPLYRHPGYPFLGHVPHKTALGIIEMSEAFRHC